MLKLMSWGKSKNYYEGEVDEFNIEEVRAVIKFWSSCSKWRFTRNLPQKNFSITFGFPLWSPVTSSELNCGRCYGLQSLMTGLEVEGEGRRGEEKVPFSSLLLPLYLPLLPYIFFFFQDGVQDKFTTELSFKSMPALQANVHKILSFLESY